MAWSEDTRCLYCEGRLPLYRKITHGQFCSSAHRKAYWEEQERLAVERLHQSHNSLRAHRSAAEEESATQPELPSVHSAHLLPEASAAPLIEQAPLTVPDLAGCIWTEVRPCYSCSLHFIATEPCEYEIALHPFVPSVGAQSGFETRAVPSGKQVPVPGFTGATLPLGSAHSKFVDAEFAEYEIQTALRHPASGALSLEMRMAARVVLPLAGGRQAGCLTSSEPETLHPLEAALAPSTNIALKIAPQGDLLLELLDQQVPHPDSLLALSVFAVQGQSRPAEVIDANLDPPSAATPVAAIQAAVPEYQLGSAGMQPISASLSPAQLPSNGLAAIAEIPLDANVATGYASMPAPAALAYQFSSGGLERLPSTLLEPAAGAFTLEPSHAAVDLSGRASDDIAYPSLSALAGALAAASPVEKLESIGTAGLRKLSSSLLKALAGEIGPRVDGMAWDLSGAVSSDVTLPNFAAAVSSPAEILAVPQSTGILPLRFEGIRAAESVMQPVARLLPQVPEPQPLLPNSKLEPMDRKPAEDALRAKGRGMGSLVPGEGLSKLVPAWAHASGFWQHAPRDLKLLLFAIPALLALVFHPGLPRVAYAAPQGSGFSGGLKRVINDQFSGLRQTLENRAAIALDEDFRSGLDNWVSPGGSTTEWSFDSTGFVKPGPLAIYRPSANLADYQTQFMGTIDKKALSWVVRAKDFENFYVIKLVVVKPGPIPTIGLTRYAVIGGKAQDRHDVNIPLNARADTLYSIRMNVQGSNFSVEVQGQMADSWTETRLPRGGVGFFTARGEESRVRWVQITHQYDMLGRLCAYLAPYDTTNGSWQP